MLEIVIPYRNSTLNGVPDENPADYVAYLNDWGSEAPKPVEKKTSFWTKAGNALLDFLKPTPTEETKKDTQDNQNPPQEQKKEQLPKIDEQKLFDSLTPEQRKEYIKNNPNSTVVKNYLMWRNIKVAGIVVGGVVVVGGGIYLYNRSQNQE